MSLRFATGLLVSALAIPSCRSRSSTNPSDDGADHPIDRMYVRYKETGSWIDPNDASKTLSPEMLQSYCAACNYMCMQDMRPISKHIPIKTDADLAPLVRWLRDDDSCVRDAAQIAVVGPLGFREGGRSVSDQDPEGYEFHEIVQALKTRLDRSRVAYDRKIFDGLMLSLNDKDFAPILRGKWAQPVNNERWQMLVEIDAETIRLTRKMLVDSGIGDSTGLYKISELEANAKDQFVVETDGLRDAEERRVKAPPRAGRSYLFWPVAKDIVWFQYSNEGSKSLLGWTKLLRVRV